MTDVTIRQKAHHSYGIVTKPSDWDNAYSHIIYHYRDHI